MTAGRRDQLASALFRFDVHSVGGLAGESYEAAADALLPTIDAMIRQAQAEALESAAEDWNDIGTGPDADDTHHWLRDRAAALRPTTDRRDVTQDAP